MHEWLKQFPIQQFKRNTYLFCQGDSLQYCYYITSGICAQLINFKNGDGITSQYYFEGDMLSLWGVLKGRVSYPGSMLCKTNVYAVVIPCRQILEKMNTSFEFYRWAAEKVMHNNLYVYELYQKKTKGNSEEMLAYTIKALLQKDCSGNYFLSKIFTIVELSQHLRLHRVTVSRIFRVLQSEGILEKGNEGWLIKDFQRLSALADGDDFLPYQ